MLIFHLYHSTALQLRRENMMPRVGWGTLQKRHVAQHMPTLFHLTLCNLTAGGKVWGHMLYVSDKTESEPDKFKCSHELGEIQRKQSVSHVCDF